MYMKIYDETLLLYLETYASGIGLRAALLQTRGGTSFPRNIAPDNSILKTHPVCKREPVVCRMMIKQHWKRITRYTIWAQKVPSLLLCGRGGYNNRSQTTSGNLQERCSNTVSENTMNSLQNMPVQSKNHIQTWTKSVHSRLALQTKPQRKQRQRNTWHAVECWHHTDNCKHPRLHNNTAVTSGSPIRWLPTTNQRLYHQRLAREQRSNTTRHDNILDILRWYGSDLMGLYWKPDM